MGHCLLYLWGVHRAGAGAVWGTCGAVIFWSQILAVGIPPSGSQWFGLISGLYIQLRKHIQSLRPGNGGPVGLLRCPGVCLMRASGIWMIVDYSSLYYCEMLKRANFGWAKKSLVGVIGACHFIINTSCSSLPNPSVFKSFWSNSSQIWSPGMTFVGFDYLFTKINMQIYNC